MGKKLVIAEKPSVGRDIARVLGCNIKHKSYIEGKDYIVTYAMGHLITLASPSVYDKKYEEWSLMTLPMIPSKFKLEVIGNTSHQYKQIKQLLHRNDVTDIIIATDAGREGELVARWILEYAGVNKPIKRLWISSVTDQAIKQGFSKLEDGHKYDHLFQAAVARAKADWLIGLNASRALTCKYNASLSCGRVQTPTLKIVEDREKAITSFIPDTLYGLKVVINSASYDYCNPQNKKVKSKNYDQIKKIQSELGLAKMVIKSVDYKIKKKYPEELYDLTTLQRDADRLYDFSAKETLRTMQGLYETHKVLTYPRTDSRYLTEDIVETLSERVGAVRAGDYKKHAALILRNKIKGHKSFVDDKKVTDHHAIIPTEEAVDLRSLSVKEYKIYDLVVKRFLSVLMPPSEYEIIEIVGHIHDKKFYRTISRITKQGFEALYSGEKTVDQTPIPRVGESIDITRIDLVESQTTPPPRLTEGGLLGIMENPSTHMKNNDKLLKDTIRTTGGLGTVATRADIIEKLYNHNLLEKRGKNLFTTSKGRQLLMLVPDELRTPDLTANLEMDLSKIAKGELKSSRFMDELITYTKEVVSKIKASDIVYKHDNATASKCPECGKVMLAIESKHGKALVCSDRECGHRQNISKTTNARCPNCHKKLNMVGEGVGKRFVCKCGYKEKLESFNQKRQGNKKQMGKRDVGRYLNKQSTTEENFNSPFANLLDKMDK